MAAKQAVDSMRAYRELRRVETELESHGGSMHWKKVGHRTYLIQKVRERNIPKVASKGARSPETELLLVQHKEKKAQLESRERSLRETVETLQRLNKATRVGVVPPPIVKTLNKLDKLGLEHKYLVLGSAAIYAYGQGSGLRIDRVTNEQSPCSVQLAIDTDTVPAKTWLDKISKAIQSIGEVQVLAGPRNLSRPSTDGLVLSVTFKKAPRATAGKQFATRWTVREPQRLLKIIHSIRSTPPYEQVVIDENGKMAIMRTLDPAVFVKACDQIAKATPENPEAQDACMQVQLVNRLLKEHMVVSKWIPVEQDLVQEKNAV